MSNYKNEQFASHLFTLRQPLRRSSAKKPQCNVSAIDAWAPKGGHFPSKLFTRLPVLYQYAR